MAKVKNIGVLVKKENPKAVSFFEKLLLWLKKEGVKVQTSESSFASCELLMTLGGDGTFIKGVRFLNGACVPVVGVRLGEYGFLTEISPDHFEKELKPFIEGDFKIEERLKVRASVIRRRKSAAFFHGLNDAVLHTTGLSRISNYKVSIDGHLLTTLKADGIVISTPTGSTAYSLAAGGPLIDPKNSVMVVTPICPQNTAHKPMVISQNSSISIEIICMNCEVLLTIDGQEQLKLEEGDKIEVQKSDQKAYFAKHNPNNYFELLRNKVF